MTTPAEYKKRIEQMRGLQHDHRIAGFWWMIAALVIYLTCLALAGWVSYWWYLLLLPAWACFYIGGRHHSKARKYDWLILEQTDKAFLEALRRAENERQVKPRT